jgi:glucose/arabinose dehydrogenase
MTRRVPGLAPLLFLSVSALFACGGGNDAKEAASASESAAMAEAAGPTVVASGLNTPMGVLVQDDGTIWITDSGTGGTDTLATPDAATGEVARLPFGKTARLVRVDPSGTQTDVVSDLPSLILPEAPIGAARLAMWNGSLYLTSGGWQDGTGPRPPANAALMRLDGDHLTEVLNTWDIEKGKNPEGALVEAHPFGITAGPDGALWIADAAGNDLFRVASPSGTLQLVTVFHALPGPVPNPNRGNAMETEAVPTGIAFMNGEAYVSFLPGAPFVPGSGKVVHVSSSGEYEDYATGFSMLSDLKTGPDGKLYGVSMGTFTEQGPTPNSGAILRIGPGETSEPVVSGLQLPTSVAFDKAGNAYVTISALGQPGAGQVVKYPHLVSSGS